MGTSLICLLATSISFSQVTFVRQTLDSGFGVFFVRSYDFDGDGDLDVLAGGEKELAWFENKGGNPPRKHLISNVQGLVWSIYPIDIDGDGDLDVATAEQDKMVWYENKGSGFSRTIFEHGYTFAESVGAADFDEDGDVDIVGLRWGTDAEPEFAFAGLGVLSSWRNNGNQKFTRHDIQPNFPNVHKLVLADINEDGRVDIVVCGKNSESGLNWFENLSGAGFARHKISRDAGLSVAAADINGDSNIDIVYCEPDEGRVVLFRGNGNGGFSRQVVASSLDWPVYPAVSDVNQDGKVDLVIATKKHPSNHNLVWLENTGGTSFVKHVISTSITKPFSVATADLSGDGVPDVVAGSRFDGSVWWWKTAGVADQTPPVISSVAVTGITMTSAVVNWSTDEPADGQVEYGLST
ncbi:MAG: VCBS repeat-containing protein, partial [Calditrichaeota bacterium]